MTVGSFAAALNAPFSEKALGAQIPDVYSYPTDTRHFRQSFVVTCDNGGAAEVVILPNPVLSIAAPQRKGTAQSGSNYFDPVSGGTPIGTPGYDANGNAAPITVDNSTIDSTASGNGNVMHARGCVSQSSLVQLFIKWRVVGFGYKIRALGNLSSTQGRVQVASIPAPANLPRANLWDLDAGYRWPQCQAYYQIFGQSASGSGSTGTRAQFVNAFVLPGSATGVYQQFTGNLLDYPINCEATSVQLQSAPLRGHGKIASKMYDEWRNNAIWFSNEIWNADTDSYITDGAANATGPAVLNFDATLGASHNFDSNNCDGWNCVPVAFLGCGANAQFEIELMYHVEGVPLLSIGNQTLNKGLGASCCHHDPIEVMAALTTNATSG